MTRVDGEEEGGAAARRLAGRNRRVAAPNRRRRRRWRGGRRASRAWREERPVASCVRRLSVGAHARSRAHRRRELAVVVSSAEKTTLAAQPATDRAPPTAPLAFDRAPQRCPPRRSLAAHCARNRVSQVAVKLLLLAPLREGRNGLMAGHDHSAVARRRCRASKNCADLTSSHPALSPQRRRSRRRLACGGWSSSAFWVHGGIYGNEAMLMAGPLYVFIMLGIVPCLLAADRADRRRAVDRVSRGRRLRRVGAGGVRQGGRLAPRVLGVGDLRRRRGDLPGARLELRRHDGADGRDQQGPALGRHRPRRHRDQPIGDRRDGPLQHAARDHVAAPDDRLHRVRAARGQAVALLGRPGRGRLVAPRVVDPLALLRLLLPRYHGGRARGPAAHP